MSWGQFTYSEIDNCLFEHLRRRVVALGYYPDLTLFQPTTPTNVINFNAALAVIKSTKNPINIVGVGAFIDKGQMELNTLYVHRVSKDKGSVAMFDTGLVRTDGLTTPPDANTTYGRVSTKGFTQNVQYEVRFIANNQDNADVLSGIILFALTNGRDYFDIYDLNTGLVVPDKQILLEFVGEQDLNLYEFKEYIYRFTVIDAWIVLGDNLPDGIETIINPNIVPITQIDLNLETD